MAASGKGSESTKPKHERLMQLFTPQNVPPELDVEVLKHLRAYPNIDYHLARKRQENWLSQLLVKTKVLAKKMREIERIAAFMRAPDTSADLRQLALVTCPEMRDNSVVYERRAYRTIVAPLFLVSFHVSNKEARSLWLESMEGNSRYPDRTVDEADCWRGGELPSIEKLVKRFHIMRHYDGSLTHYGTMTDYYLQDVSEIRWFARRILSHFTDHASEEGVEARGRINKLRAAEYSLTQLIRKEYEDWELESGRFEADMAAMERYHNLTALCRTHADRESVRFRFTGEDGVEQARRVYTWTNCRLPDEERFVYDDELPDEGNSDSGDTDEW